MAPPAAPSTPRVLVAFVVVALVSGLGGLILGEYEFEGLLPFIAGPLFGLVVAELALAVSRWRDVTIAAYTAAAVALGLAYAGRIDANHGVEPIKELVWVAAGLGAVVAFARLFPLRR